MLSPSHTIIEGKVSNREIFLIKLVLQSLDQSLSSGMEGKPTLK